MKIIAELNIPQMFTAHASSMNNGSRDEFVRRQYICHECGHAFASAWPIKSNMGYQYTDGKYFCCPKCGYRHSDHVAYVDECYVSPDVVRLAVKELRDTVILEVSSKCVGFRGYLDPAYRPQKEVYRFDVVKQTADVSFYNKGSKIKTVDLVNPFGFEELADSILQFFVPGSLANKKNKSGLIEILKALRKAVKAKLENRLGYKITGMYVSPGQEHGTFLLPIFNLAFRTCFPEAPNLPDAYRDDTNDSFWEGKLINEDFWRDIYARRKEPYMPEIIKMTGLPDKPAVRHILTTNSFDAVILARGLSLCDNYDYGLQMYKALVPLLQKTKGHAGYKLTDELTAFLQVVKQLYGEAGMVRMVEEADSLNLYDCQQLYKQLNAENKKALEIERVKLSDLHDLMAVQHLRQNHKNTKLDIPDHIVKRLSMQKDRLKFFLPKESLQLVEAGYALHNCVSSYSHAVKNGKKQVVLVADKNGKLTACLEINGNEIVQAKLDRNKPASSNLDLNNEIIVWAKEVGLKIKTNDIRIPLKQKVKATIPA